jgi:tetratricopeptide (TPR) repeat protein
MKKISRVLVIVAFIFSFSAVSAQSPKKFIELGEKAEKQNDFKSAIDNYSKALELDAKNSKALKLRAAAFEKSGRIEEASADYENLVGLEPKEKEYYYNTARLLADLNKLKDADNYLRKAIDLDKGYTEALTLEVKVLYNLRDFKNGLMYSQLAIDDKKTNISLYNHALNLDSLKNYAEAEKFYKNARSVDAKFIAAFIGQANCMIKLNRIDEAIKVCDEALKIDASNNEALMSKALAFAAKKEYQSAINEITKVIISVPSERAYLYRASFYEVLGQHQTAASDYTQVIKLNDKNVLAYLRRAAANEQIQNYKAALADYNMVASLAKGNNAISDLVVQARKKIFELNRESDKPSIELTSIKADRNIIKVSADKNELSFRGVVKDASRIKSMNVNSGKARFSADSLNPTFVVEVSDLIKLNDITISATDEYNNTRIIQFKLEKTESDKPIIAIEVPYTSFENEIALDNPGAEIFIQGKIKDASLIETIIIDGVIASFNPTQINPAFQAQVKVTDKSVINMVVRDIYGNETNQNFTLNRTGITAAVDNPMGNTWVIFIENSKYTNFPSLEGPAKDVIAMRAALANYKITKIIHKKDMTKQEMEKFFAIELRDYVKNNNINSLLIWYAGHGKYVSPTGYWVPADGKPDDEFSFFGINNLKAAMQSYTGKLIHTLVITDACESGATFLMAMRGGDEEKRCDNFELTRAKSAQVFTSAGYELASDNSQFTKTFVSVLNNNLEYCLPIEKIVKKVSVSVTAAGNQTPKFGKIKDLEDEGGTYFFIRK